MSSTLVVLGMGLLLIFVGMAFVLNAGSSFGVDYPTSHPNANLYFWVPAGIGLVCVFGGILFIFSLFKD